MVKVTMRPWEEVIIHESIQYVFDDFIKLCSMGVQPGGLANPLHWAEGIVFRVMAMPQTDEVIKEQLAGKIHWSAIEWAIMPKYQQVIMIGDINAKIPIVNASSTAILRDVIISIKQTART